MIDAGTIAADFDVETGQARARVQQMTQTFDGSLQSALNLQQVLTGLGQGFQSIGAGITQYVTRPLMAASKSILGLAADQIEADGKFGVIFGTMTEASKKRADAMAAEFKLSKYDIRNTMAMLGQFATSAGATDEAASDMSATITRFATDWASLSNLNVNDTQEAMKTLFTGESERLKSMGLDISEVAMKREAERAGIKKSISEMSQLEKAQLRLAAVQSQGAKAQDNWTDSLNGVGSAAETGRSLIVVMQSLRGRLSEMATDFGMKITPYIQEQLPKIVAGFEKLSRWANDNAPRIARLVGEFIPRALDKLMEVVDKLMSKWDSMSDAQKDSAIGWLGTIAILGPVIEKFGGVLMIVGQLVPGIMGMVSAFRIATAATSLASTATTAAGAAAAATTASILPMTIAIIAAVAAIGALAYAWNRAQKAQEAYSGSANKIAKQEAATDNPDKVSRRKATPGRSAMTTPATLPSVATSAARAQSASGDSIAQAVSAAVSAAMAGSPQTGKLVFEIEKNSDLDRLRGLGGSLRRA